ncbi:P-II family nitrogen regulator [Pseudanabaena sp. Chao 1811]|jgi:nitrogen regulatory protein PII|uniref:P-II family nitrogen regulator n=1 Tax=Pseudanabaena sp. Chao 1811 TaxID=2963092 RepID=UPI0022F39DA2|nr:P-II family nitrogen regulator [Pseudanabaena sp. Chao 1811]
MHAVKRIEIVSDSVESHKIIKVLETVGVLNYTVIRNVVGKGVSGTNSGDLDMSMLENDYVIAFFLADKTKLLVENLRPVINKFGGACYVSDAMEINSIQCVAS